MCVHLPPQPNHPRLCMFAHTENPKIWTECGHHFHMPCIYEVRKGVVTHALGALHFHVMNKVQWQACKSSASL